ncbi:hypothetical protein SDC9_108808 [bioreactor metagenome]|uniref:Uncharacterized protein n=1 Tax=bioreactor metagenome TaxID=1076179 RepID=A0A645BJL8_9ZZZZ
MPHVMVGVDVGFAGPVLGSQPEPGVQEKEQPDHREQGARQFGRPAAYLSVREHLPPRRIARQVGGREGAEGDEQRAVETPAHILHAPGFDNLCPVGREPADHWAQGLN